MSHKNKYKIDKLVSDQPNLAKFEDPLLHSPGGIVIESGTLWVGNNGGKGVEDNFSHYSLKGEPLGNFPFDKRIVPATEQVSLLFNLSYQYKLVSALTSNVIIQIPTPNLTPPPYLSVTFVEQLLSFLNGPNGYLTTPQSPPVDVTILVNFCNNQPSTTLNPVQQQAFFNANQGYFAVAEDPLNPDAIFPFAQLLLSAQATVSNSSPFDDFHLPQIISQRVASSEDVQLTDIAPIGVIVNNTRNFVITQQGRSAAALLIMGLPDGIIQGYSPIVDPLSAHQIINDNRSKCVYSGLTIAHDNLYVADFSNNQIHVFDFQFKKLEGFSFVDPTLPNGFSTLNIVNIDDQLYVLYSKLNLSDAEYNKAIIGPGLGYISLFNPDGTFIKRLVSGGDLNVPWGLVVAPRHFGKFKGKFLVANRGDGKINVYDSNWKHLGRLKKKHKKTITLPGLWGLASHHKSVYFTSTLTTQDGLIGKIHPADH